MAKCVTWEQSWESTKHGNLDGEIFKLGKDKTWEPGWQNMKDMNIYFAIKVENFKTKQSWEFQNMETWMA